jgi:post-segregation antitoxin (ccd killing protein)
MASTWQDHGNNISITWQEHMAITWQDHRENSWQEHGKAMAGGMARARQERGKSTAIIIAST